MRIIVDSGFWFGFMDKSDGYHKQAEEIFEKISDHNPVFLIPYPSLYETLNTKMLRLRNHGNPRVHKFFTSLKAYPKQYIKVCDTNYRDKAFENTVSGNPRGLSFVDNIIREMMCDKNQKIDALITFNTGDFIDVCTKEGIYIFDNNFEG